VVHQNGRVEVAVRDDGAGVGNGRAGDSETGHGIIGMRERAEALGGSLSAGPASDGGFLVTASLPVNSASGFLLKDAQPTDLLAAVHLVDRGESVLAPTLVRRLIATYVETPTTAPKPAWLDSLTPREIEVLVAVARGLSNAEIGDALYMSAATAKTHVGHLLTKLNARDRTHLVIAAYEGG
jgi:DNA-binding CsgD family transcriptional regulator